MISSVLNPISYANYRCCGSSPTQRVMDLTLTQTSVIYNLVCVIP